MPSWRQREPNSVARSPARTRDRYGNNGPSPGKSLNKFSASPPRCLPLKHWKMDRDETTLHITTRPVSRLHPPLHHLARSPAFGGRDGTILSSHSAEHSSNGPDTGTTRPNRAYAGR